MALSSSEAEYIALAEIVKGVLHLWEVQQFATANEDDVPIQIFDNNLGAIELANNLVSSKTSGTSA